MFNISFKTMFRSVLVVASALVLQPALAQNSGIFPLTGIKYFKEGINMKTVSLRMDGAQFLSNRVPAGKELEFNVQQPTGFTEQNKNIYLGAELTIQSPKGDVLLTNPNLFVINEKIGYVAKNFKDLSIKLALTPDILKNNTSCLVKIRLYDLKSKNQLRMEFPAAIARPGEAITVSKTVAPLKSADPLTLGLITGVTAKNVNVTTDTTIRVAPTMAYTSMDIATIDGTSISGIFSGKESFWVYDANLNEVKISQNLLKQVKGAMENSTVNYTLKIPYRLKAALNSKYTVRFRWESADRMQVIDVVTVR